MNKNNNRCTFFTRCSRLKLYLSLALWVGLTFGQHAVANKTEASELVMNKTKSGYHVELKLEGRAVLSAPPEGLWSVAHNVNSLNDLDWESAAPTEYEERGPWRILKGTLSLEDGDWLMEDACQRKTGYFKCVRRMQWTGTKPLEKTVLSVRWLAPKTKASVFQPGLMYYGNPAAKGNDPARIAHMNGEVGEFVYFEEHRFPMPFTSLEWKSANGWTGASLHSLPSPVPYPERRDLWWSLGAEHFEDRTELRLLSGPTGYNRKADIIKLYQKKSAPYRNTTLTAMPGMVLEKTYYLQAYPVARQGNGFRKPMRASLDIFQPGHSDEFPSVQDIVKAKLRFLRTRYMEGQAVSESSTPTATAAPQDTPATTPAADDKGTRYAGFNMFDHKFRKRIVMGWAGQSDAAPYALLALENLHRDPKLIRQAQAALDFLATAPISKTGFPVEFDVEKNQWRKQDPVSQGQALFMFAKSIAIGKKRKDVDTSRWELFFNRAATVHAQRILEKDWRPRSTSEGFLIAPLALGYQIFGIDLYKRAALKAADHYGARHLTMEEPYWGGTLDAKGEDKEGAWAAFQGFMAAYELTEDNKYLEWAQHAGDAVLSYMVVWDIPMPPGRLANHAFKSRGWTFVSPQNQHLDVYGVLVTPWLYKLGELTQNPRLKKLAELMYRSCGQLIDPYGSQGEQIQQTNFVQDFALIKKSGDNPDPSQFRGGYSENWTVLWITTHFLTAAAIFEEIGVPFYQVPAINSDN